MKNPKYKCKGNCSFSESFTVKPSMLPHESHLMREVDGVLTKHSDVEMLLHAEKFANMYGPQYLQDRFANRQASAFQQSLDKTTDDVRMSSISSKYVQRGSEIKASIDADSSTGEKLATSVVDELKTKREKKQAENTGGVE